MGSPRSFLARDCSSIEIKTTQILPTYSVPANTPYQKTQGQIVINAFCPNFKVGSLIITEASGQALDYRLQLSMKFKNNFSTLELITYDLDLQHHTPDLTSNFNRNYLIEVTNKGEVPRSNGDLPSFDIDLIDSLIER